jgi:hypothetical protein
MYTVNVRGAGKKGPSRKYSSGGVSNGSAEAEATVLSHCAVCGLLPKIWEVSTCKTYGKCGLRTSLLFFLPRVYSYPLLVCVLCLSLSLLGLSDSYSVKAPCGVPSPEQSQFFGFFWSDNVKRPEIQWEESCGYTEG